MQVKNNNFNNFNYFQTEGTVLLSWRQRSLGCYINIPILLRVQWLENKHLTGPCSHCSPRPAGDLGQCLRKSSHRAATKVLMLMHTLAINMRKIPYIGKNGYKMLLIISFGFPSQLWIMSVHFSDGKEATHS